MVNELLCTKCWLQHMVIIVIIKNISFIAMFHDQLYKKIAT